MPGCSTRAPPTTPARRSTPSWRTWCAFGSRRPRNAARSFFSRIWESIPRPCQLDTNIHLWRITAHNAVHRREVAEMLKAPPYDFRAGAVAPTAPHKPAELGDPGDGLAQRRWLDRRGGDPMDGTIQRLPFVGL